MHVFSLTHFKLTTLPMPDIPVSTKPRPLATSLHTPLPARPMPGSCWQRGAMGEEILEELYAKDVPRFVQLPKESEQYKALALL